MLDDDFLKSLHHVLLEVSSLSKRSIHFTTSSLDAR